MLRVNGFYGHVRRNDVLSGVMFVGFAIAFQLIAAVILIVPLGFVDMDRMPLLNPGGYFLFYGPLMFLLSIGLFLIGFALHTDQVRETVGFRIVARRDHPRLVNIVERLAIQAGLPCPKVGVIDSDARNAFACGHSSASAIVVVTRGLVEALDDDELAAVVAHEITHIANGDIRLMACANIMMGIVLRAEKLNVLRLRGKRAGCAVFLPALMITVMVAQAVSKAAITLARMSRLALSNAREFIADAEAVRLTHNPAALISALRKVEGRSAVAGVDAGLDAMMIDGMTDGPWATHPTVAERIQTLMQLSGGMTVPLGPRLDTRPIGDIMAHRTPGGFGRKGATAASLATHEPARKPEAQSLWARVSEGDESNAFGVTPQQKSWMTTLFVIFIAIPVFFTILFA